MSNYYIKRAGKTVGPLSWERVEALLNAGKLDGDAPVAESPQGPWTAALDLQAQKQAAAEMASAAPVISDGLPAFEQLGNAPPPMSTPYWNVNQSSPSQSSSREGNRSSRERPVDGSEETSFFARVFCPWKGENSNARYGNLDRYIEIFRSLNRVAFIISLIGLALYAIQFPIMVLLEPGVPFSNRIENFVPYLFGSVFISVIGLIVLHLLYIVSMASCDLLRLLIDLESNTRNKR